MIRRLALLTKSWRRQPSGERLAASVIREGLALGGPARVTSERRPALRAGAPGPVRPGSGGVLGPMGDLLLRPARRVADGPRALRLIRAVAHGNAGAPTWAAIKHQI